MLSQAHEYEIAPVSVEENSYCGVVSFVGFKTGCIWVRVGATVS